MVRSTKVAMCSIGYGREKGSWSWVGMNVKDHWQAIKGFARVSVVQGSCMESGHVHTRMAPSTAETLTEGRGQADHGHWFCTGTLVGKVVISVHDRSVDCALLSV